MFGPVLWLVMSSFKSFADIKRFPPRFLPYHQELAVVAGYDEPLPLYNVTLADGATAQFAQARRVGLEAQMIDPADPEAGVTSVKLSDRAPVESVRFSFDNYTRGVESFNFWRYLANSVIVTASATILTLFVNSMAAFALSKYRFRGRGFIFMLIISTLMAPLAVLAIFSTIWRWNDFLWPKIVMTENEMFTLQVGLETFQGDLMIQWDLILAMTVLTALPITFVFGFLQKHITTGIATTGMK